MMTRAEVQKDRNCNDNDDQGYQDSDNNCCASREMCICLDMMTVDVDEASRVVGLAVVDGINVPVSELLVVET